MLNQVHLQPQHNDGSQGGTLGPKEKSLSARVLFSEVGSPLHTEKISIKEKKPCLAHKCI